MNKTLDEKIKDIILDVAHDGTERHQNAYSLVEYNLITVNAFGELQPFLSDIDVKNKHNVFISNTTKMNEDWFDILEQIAKTDDTTCEVLFTSIKYCQTIEDMDDVITMCDVLDLINGDN